MSRLICLHVTSGGSLRLAAEAQPNVHAGIFSIIARCNESQNSRIEMSVSPITEIIAEIKAGRMVILVDEEDRENEGDLVLAADFVTPAAINFMATHARGLICLTLTEERCGQLNLRAMVS